MSSIWTILNTFLASVCTHKKSPSPKNLNIAAYLKVKKMKHFTLTLRNCESVWHVWHFKLKEMNLRCMDCATAQKSLWWSGGLWRWISAACLYKNDFRIRSLLIPGGWGVGGVLCITFAPEMIKITTTKAKYLHLYLTIYNNKYKK